MKFKTFAKVDGARHRSRLVVVAAALLLLLTIEFFASARVASDDDLIDGGGTMPADWQRVSQRYLKPDQVEGTFKWIHSPDGSSELRLQNSRRGIIRWVRSVKLDPGLYYLSGEIKEEGLTPNVDSAIIGLELKGNTFGVPQSSEPQASDWETGGLYFKVGKGGRNVDITCQLEGLGTVSCRHITLVKAGKPPAADVNVIDLDQYPEQHRGDKPRPYDAPSGQMWTLFLTMASLIAIAISGWIALDPRCR